MSELPEALHSEITRLCAAGDVLAQKTDYKAALAEYNKAWKLVPEPKNNWEASTWILGAIGDACFLGGSRVSGLESLFTRQRRASFAAAHFLRADDPSYLAIQPCSKKSMVSPNNRL